MRGSGCIKAEIGHGAVAEGDYSIKESSSAHSEFVQHLRHIAKAVALPFQEKSVITSNPRKSNQLVPMDSHEETHIEIGGRQKLVKA